MGSGNKVAVKSGESIWRRILWGLPLLGLFWTGRTVLFTSISTWIPLLEDAAKTGWFEDHGQKVPVRLTYTGIKGLDNFWRALIVFFTPALAGLDHRNSIPGLGQYGSMFAPQRLQSLTFLADVTCLNAIFVIESCRRGNSMTVASIPVVFGLAMQLQGGGQIVPLYFFLQYVSLPPSKYVLRSNRLVPTRYAKSLLPALLAGYVFPTIGCFWPTSSLENRQLWNFIWQFFPIWIALFHEIFARLVHEIPDDKKEIRDAADDLVWLRLTYEFLFLLSAGTYLYVFFVSPVPFSRVFFEGIWNWNKNITTVAEGAGLFLKWDEIFVMLGTAVWILLCFRDLKREKRADVGWGRILVVMLGTGVFLGPGASMTIMWAWREEVFVGKEGKW